MRHSVYAQLRRLSRHLRRWPIRSTIRKSRRNGGVSMIFCEIHFRVWSTLRRCLWHSRLVTPFTIVTKGEIFIVFCIFLICEVKRFLARAAIYITGSCQPHALWSRVGRQRVLNYLKREVFEQFEPVGY